MTAKKTALYSDIETILLQFLTEHRITVILLQSAVRLQFVFIRDHSSHASASHTAANAPLLLCVRAVSCFCLWTAIGFYSVNTKVISATFCMV